MTPKLLEYLCDPKDKSNLKLENGIFDSDGYITQGTLISTNGNSYPIIDGIPRFVTISATNPVFSFGSQWNYFNFDLFKQNWLLHTIKSTFGSPSVFKNKVVIDCGAGSGMQTKWISEYGASHVIALELSHATDGVIKKNLEGLRNVDVIQCSIDNPPIKSNSVNGIVICHNVIQHTESVEKTALALWSIVGESGEFVFNCYPRNDEGILRKIRLKIYFTVRFLLSKSPFILILTYSHFMSVLRLLPILGEFFEKSGLMVRGDVPSGDNYYLRAYKSGVLNTFDCFGSHKYQHLIPETEMKDLLSKMQPNPKKIMNYIDYFKRPQPIGIALRLSK